MGNFAENLNLGNRFRPPLKTRKFITLKPQKIQLEKWVLCTSQWEPSRVIINYLELINMSVSLFCHGRAVDCKSFQIII